MINNLSQNTIVSKTYSYKTGVSKIQGLLLKKQPETLVFKTRFGIHTFFMKFPIDVMVLNKNKKVVFLKESVKPNKFVLWNPKYNLILEMPIGSIKESKTKIGDYIDVDL